jgi:hypothetical protein
VTPPAKPKFRGMEMLSSVGHYRVKTRCSTLGVLWLTVPGAGDIA